MSARDTTKPIKLFISHAWEDKEDFVRPLVSTLQQAGFAVWYDEYELTLGDSLLRRISEGLRTSDFGIVVLSPAFFRKKWPQAELDGLFALETDERKIILPVWKEISEEDVKAFSPILAGRLGSRTQHGLNSVVEDIERAVQAAQRTATFSEVDNVLDRFRSLNEEVSGTRNAIALEESHEGVNPAKAAAKEILGELRSRIGEIAEQSKDLKISLDKKETELIHGGGFFGIEFVIDYVSKFTNVVTESCLDFRAYRGREWFGDKKVEKPWKRLQFEPTIHHSGKLGWRSRVDKGIFSSDQVVITILNELASTFQDAQSDAMKNRSRQ
jgi:hypothetical protein